MDTDVIRKRLNVQGWTVRELPIRQGQKIARWKLVLLRGEKSLEVQGNTLQEAMETAGKTLGVIAR